MASDDDNGSASNTHLPNTYTALIIDEVTTTNNHVGLWVDNINLTAAADTTAPAFDTAPSASNIDHNSFDLTGSLDEAGDVHYVVLTDGATAPTTDDVQAGTGSGGAGAVASGTASPSTGNFDFSFADITGLAASTAYDVYVVAQDDESTPNEQASPTLVEITTTAAPNTPPTFDNSDPGGLAVDETSTDTTSVIHDVNANDGDGTDSVTYSITNGNTGGAFAIDADDGEIRLATPSALDHESKDTYTLEITADDGESSNNTATQTISISINDIAPAITGGQSFAANESDTNTTSLGTVATTGDDDTVTFSIQSGNTGNAFAIDPNTGELSVNDTSQLDASATPSYTLGIRASDGATNSDVTVTVNVTDDVSPTVTSVASSSGDGTYKAGDTITVTVQFDEAVTVTGTPTLTLETGTTDRTATYASGSGTDTLSFTYTVQAGDESADLDYTATTALALNGGTIKDSAGNDATLTLASPGGAGSLGANAALVVDGAAPTITSITSTSDDRTYGVIATINISVRFDEEVDFTANGGTLQATLSTGATVTLASSTIANQIGFTGMYCVGEGETDSADLDVTAVTLTGGATLVAHDDGVPADLSLPTGNNLADNKDIAVDANTPATPTIDLDAASDTGVSQTDNETNDTTPTVSGSGETGVRVTVYNDADNSGHEGSGELLGYADVTGGTWSLTVASLGEGTHNLRAYQIDAADNTSDSTAILAVTVDTTAPSGHGISADDSTINNNEKTSTSFTFSGAEVGTTYDLTVSSSGGGTNVTASGTVGSSTEQITGIDVSGLNDGTLTYSVVLTDTAGNAAGAVTDTATLDTTGPTAVDDTDASVSEDANDAVLTGVSTGNDNLADNDTGADGTAPVAAVNGSGANVGAQVAGTNGGLFTVNANGTVSFDANGDFEALDDGGSDTTSVTVSIQDTAGNTADSTLTVTVTGANDAPSGADKTLTVTTGAVLTIQTADFGFIDPDTGDALDHITVDTVPTTGTLFVDTDSSGALDGGETALTDNDTVSAADIAAGKLLYEAPATAGSEALVFTVNDGTVDSANATLTLTTQAPSNGGGGNTGDSTTTQTTEGTTVTTTTTTNSDGTTTETKTIDPFDGFQAGEDEDDGDNALSDHVLAGTTAAPAVIARLPLGVGLTSSGKTSTQSPDQAQPDLIARIEAETEAGSETQTEMTGAGRAFLNGLAEGTQLYVNTITPTVDGDSPPDQPIIITGADSEAGTQEALVIDVSGLPSGTVLQLDGVEFAAIVGAATVTGGAGDNVVVGDDGAQVIVLGEGDDILDGGGGDDVVGSLGGDDILVGGAGNDTISGGDGVDVAQYAGTFAETAIERGESLAVRDGGGTDTVADDVELLAFSGDGTMTLARPGGATWLDGLGFDAGFYLAQNADVAEAVAQGAFTDAAAHFSAFGLFEGRAPSALFDEAWYLEAYADVAAAVAAGTFASGLQHYAEYGQSEARDAGPWFDRWAYLEANADVADAGMDAVVHFLLHGAGEGRMGFVLDDDLLVA